MRKIEGEKWRGAAIRRPSSECDFMPQLFASSIRNIKYQIERQRTFVSIILGLEPILSFLNYVPILIKEGSQQFG